MRSPLALSCTSGALLLLSARAFSLGGTMLVTDGENFQPGSIIKVDCATGARTTLQSGGNMFGPTFSPDGTKIAFWRAGVSGGPGKIMTMNVDGSGVREVCSTTYPDHRRQAPSWTADGYLYWAEMEPYIYRVSVDTGVKELFYQIDAPVHLPVVSLDSTRLAAMKPLSSYFVFGVDLISGTEMDYGPGCYGSVSPNGELVTHNIDHRTAYIHRFDDGTVYTTVTAPTDTSDASEHRFSRVSNDYIVYSDHRREAYVVNIHTDEKFCHSAGQAWDYYPDTEPEPMLLIRPSALTFEALLGLLSPEPQVVAVTGMGLLSDVTSQVSYEGAGGWLTVVRQGHQNSQTLVNTLTTGTLPVGTYSATVEVACDNASNSPQSYR